MNVGAVIVLALISAVGDAGSSAPVSFETMRLSAVRDKDGTTQAVSRVEIRQADGKTRLEEERALTDGSREAFRVELDSRTLRPVSWTRTFSGDGKSVSTELRVTETHIEATTRDGDAVRTQTLELPEHPFCIVPLAKLYLARAVEEESIPAVFRNVVALKDGTLSVVVAKVKDLGIETIEVPAGSYRCRRLRITPSVPLAGALLSPGDMWLDVEGTHPVVRATIRPTRFSALIRTDMQSYERSVRPQDRSGGKER